jgi:thiamine pyrophosphate-dependent acetolactate synthase large subunit-like protein
LNVKINKFAGLLKKAERPIFLVGNGSRGAIKNIIEFLDQIDLSLNI